MPPSPPTFFLGSFLCISNKSKTFIFSSVDYITWNGPNPDLCTGTRNLAIGSDSSLRTGRTVVTNGPNHELYTGSKGLAKGSIYSQMNRQMANVKCN